MNQLNHVVFIFGNYLQRISVYIYTHTYIYIYSAGILIEEMNVNQFIMERFIGIVLGLLWYCGFRYKNHPEFAMGLSTKLIGIIRRPGIYETVCKR